MGVLRLQHRLAPGLEHQPPLLCVWGANDPVWRVYAYGPMSNILPEGVPTDAYVMVLVADDAS